MLVERKQDESSGILGERNSNNPSWWAHTVRPPYSRLLAIWTLRALSPGLGRAQFLVDSSYSDTNIAQFLNLPENPDVETFRSVPRLMNDLSASLEKSGEARFLAKAQKNFDQFAKALKFDATEQRILEWFACMEVESNLDIRPVINPALRQKPRKV